MGSGKKSRKPTALVRTEEGEYVPFEYEERRGTGRPQVLTTQVGVRVPPEAKRMLELIAEYEYIYKVSELVRRWITDKIISYDKNPRFKQFLKRRAEIIAEGKQKAMEDRKRTFLEDEK